MAKRINDIKLNADEVKALAKKVEVRFNAETGNLEKFTGSLKSDIYERLQKHISINVDDKTVIGLSTLRNIIRGRHNGNFLPGIYTALVSYTSNVSSGEAVSQKVYWGVNYCPVPGAFINRMDGMFIPWEQLKKELEERVMCRCPKIIPVTSKLRLDEYHGRSDWTISVIDRNEVQIGSVWIGTDPENGWRSDGLIRLGKTVDDNKWMIYQIFSRYSDGSYRMIESKV